jgi:serine/threonine protein kinase
VAIKILKVESSQGVSKEQGEAVIAEFHREVSMLSRLRHPNICLFMGCCLKAGSHSIVTELVMRGSLWDVLREPKLNTSELPCEHSEWNWDRVRHISNGIACGMAYLHGIRPHAVLHRDLKSSNILCDDSYCAKICDFGLSRIKAKVSTTMLSTRLEQAAMTVTVCILIKV